MPTSYLDRLRSEREQLTRVVAGITDRAAAEERDVTEAEEATVREQGERLSTLDRQIELFGTHLAASNRYATVIGQAEAAAAEHEAAAPPMVTVRSEPEPIRSLAESFVAAGIAQEYLDSGAKGLSRALHAGSILERTLTTTATAPMVPPFYASPLPMTAPLRPTGALSVVGRGSVSADIVHYVKDATTTAAAVVAEGAAKPETTLTLTPGTAPVLTIAHWVQITRQALADAAYIRSHIDATLRRGIAKELSRQIVAGTGTGEFLGIDAAATGTSTGSGVTAILNAIATVEGLGFAPDAILAAPATIAKMLSVAGGSGFFVGATGNLERVTSMFGVPLVPDVNVPLDKAFVSEFAVTTTLWDREQTAVYVGEQHADNFVKNILVLLGEGRFAFTVNVPAAVVETTITYPVGTEAGSSGSGA